MSTPREILERVEQAYAGCRSYRDIGEVVSVIIQGPRPWQRATTRLPFQTAFVRPHRFLFELKHMTVGPADEWPHHAVWRSSAGVFKWDADVLRPEAAVEPCPSIEAELQRLAGVSRRASRRVPALLGPFGEPEDLPAADAAQLEGLDEVDGRDAWRLQVRRDDGVEALWIDVERALVLRSFVRTLHTRERFRALRELQLAAPGLTEEQRRRIEAAPLVERDFASEATTFYRPELDVELPDGAFDVQPPV